jgi:hypothetical protein
LTELPRRQEKEAQNLARLTGWDINDIRKKVKIAKPPKESKDPEKTGGKWWRNLWK